MTVQDTNSLVSYWIIGFLTQTYLMSLESYSSEVEMTMVCYVDFTMNFQVCACPFVVFMSLGIIGT